MLLSISYLEEKHLFKVIDEHTRVMKEIHRDLCLSLVFDELCLK